MRAWDKAYQPLILKLSGSAKAFEEESSNVKELQEKKLFEILKANSRTPLGKKYSFNSISTVSEYQKALPLSVYEDYQFEENRVSALGLRGYAWSSGTSSDRKRIPVTEGLVNDFESALLPWLDSVFKAHPSISTGPSYWIVSPPFENQSEDTQLEDSLYFSDEVGGLLFQVLTTPPQLGSKAGFHEWAFVTIMHLLLERNLSWISIWSPSLLCRLLESTEELRPILTDCLKKGTCRGSGLQIGEIAERELDRALSESKDLIPKLLEQIEKSNPKEAFFPNLKFLSCWTDGWASLFIKKLKSYLPGVIIQPKGLLATEAVVTIPWPSGEPVLAYRAHFYEFVSTTSKEIFLAHELEIGETYEVVVTTSGGLYRYQLEDIVKVTGYLNLAPRLTFLRKTGGVVDMCGEKLHEAQVSACFNEMSESYNIELSGSRLRPVIEGSRAYYELVIQKSYALSPEELSQEVDKRLKKNPHYKLCRELRQLGEVAVVADKELFNVESTEKSTEKLFCLIRTPRIDKSYAGRDS